MAQILTGDIRGVNLEPPLGHELADNHPVLVVGNQRIIDGTDTALVIPLTSTAPHYPVFWSIPIADTTSWASIRHLRTLRAGRLQHVIGKATPAELWNVKNALYRELIDEPSEPAPVINEWDLPAEPGSIWTAEIAGQSGQSFQTHVLTLTSNAQNGMATILHMDDAPRNLIPSIPIIFGDPPETGHIVTYQVRSLSAPDRLRQYCGAVSPTELNTAKLRLIRHIG